MSEAEPSTEDHRPALGRGSNSRRWLVHGLELSEDLIYAVVAIVLVGIAVVLLVRTVSDAVSADVTFASRISTAVNGVLFVVIILEIYRTVVAHLEGGGFQLVPFIVIGIISAVRHILLVGTKTLGGESQKLFTDTQIELAVNAGIALALVIALILLRKYPPGDDSIEH